MNSKIYTGLLRHARTHEVEHGFLYRLHLYALDLDELEQLDRASLWFGHNRIRPIALHDRDYLFPGDTPLKEKVQRALHESGMEQTPARIILVTALRQFHYVFNPVSFFYCYDDADRLFSVLAQVNNTFGETHLYVLKPEEDGHSFRTGKVFHVSPFFPRQGRYAFRLTSPENTLSLEIRYFLEEQQVLLAAFDGTAKPMTPGILARTVLLHPLRAVMSFPRILWQAARLSLQKKLKIYSKPEPCSPMTIRHVPPSMLERLGVRVLTRFFNQLDHGRMTMIKPDGEQLLFGASDNGPEVTMTVHRYRFFSRAMLHADIGFGEAYVDGDWSSPDLVRLLTLLCLRGDAINDRRLWPALLGRTVNYLSHLRRDNSPAGSRRNISDHYDLSNDLYRSFSRPDHVLFKRYFSYRRRQS